MNESNENQQLYLKLPVDIWGIIFINLNHDPLIIMDWVSIGFNKYINCKLLIKNILLDRQINYCPRITEKCVIHKLPAINGIINKKERNIFRELGIYDLDLLLKYLQKTRTDLVKYDIVELNSDMIILYAIFDGNKFIMQAYTCYEYMNVPITLHGIIKNNIPFSYWGNDVKYFKVEPQNPDSYLFNRTPNFEVEFNYNEFIDECVKNITVGYLENIYSIYTYFIYDNKKTYIVGDIQHTTEDSEEILSGRKDFEEILSDKEYFKSEELYIKSRIYNFPDTLYLKI